MLEHTHKIALSRPQGVKKKMSLCYCGQFQTLSDNEEEGHHQHHYSLDEEPGILLTACKTHPWSPARPSC